MTQDHKILAILPLTSTAENGNVNMQSMKAETLFYPVIIVNVVYEM